MFGYIELKDKNEKNKAKKNIKYLRIIDKLMDSRLILMDV